MDNRCTDEKAFQDAREQMVLKQIIPRGIRNEAVLHALRTTPRHLFVEASKRAEAYTDHPVAIPCGQTISQPYMVALMTEMLHLSPDSQVLEIGSGSGYQTAVLAAIAKRIVSIERHAELAETVRVRLSNLGFGNVVILTGDGTLGCTEYAPYDAILATAGSPDIPDALCEQLKDGGRLVAPVGGLDVQHLTTIIRQGPHYSKEIGIACRFVPLIGEQGWNAGKEEDRY